MATVTALPDTRSRNTSASTTEGRNSAWLLAFCSVVAVCLLGYHPYAEDGGIYASALSLRLDPSLFPAYREFVVAHTGKSLFIPIVGALVRLSHMSQGVAMFALYVVSVVATLAALMRLGRTLLPSERQRQWATLLLAVSLGMPVGGTSLYLVDPYLTARSFSTPLIVLALSMLLERRYGVVAVCMAVAFAIHPLMTLWAVFPVALVLVWQQAKRPVRGAVVAGLVFVGVMGTVQALLPADAAAVRAASLSRSYWFLSQWQWYEWIGLIAPCALLLCLVGMPSVYEEFRDDARLLACAAVAAMLTVSVASLLWIHTGNAAFLLARMQPLRLLHPVYLVFLMLLAGWLSKVAGASLKAWTAFGVLLCSSACGMLYLQRTTYPNSSHMELPWNTSDNGYVQAAEWIRANTEKDALVATDANYTTASGEDAQMLRAIALRSTVPDAAKDGGISSVMPVLASAWMAGSQAQAGLAKLPDAERITRVKPLGA
ncbi:MAG: hypothetical protein V4734_11340, partial [Terriglobus sp.]